jgi:hypothetical protein
VGGGPICHASGRRCGRMSNDVNPFKGARVKVSPPMTVLHRFTKPGGHWAEIRERKVTTFLAIEYLVFVDGSLLESQLFHGAREAEYSAELEKRIAQFIDGGWTEVAVPVESRQ